jgi:hypothetical protein
MFDPAHCRPCFSLISAPICMRQGGVQRRFQTVPNTLGISEGNRTVNFAVYVFNPNLNYIFSASSEPMGMIPAVHVENKIQWASPHGL